MTEQTPIFDELARRFSDLQSEASGGNGQTATNQTAPPRDTANDQDGD